MRSLSALLLGLLLALAPLRSADVPAVPAIADSQAFAVAVIPDLKVALANLDQALASAKLPVPSGMLAAQVGHALGDPELAGFSGKPVLVAAAPGMPIPAWCAVLPLADPAPLKAFATGGGMVAEAVPGGVALGSAGAGLELAKRLGPALADLAKAVPAGSDLRLMLATDRIVRTYKPLLMMGLQMAAVKAAAGSPEQKRAQAVAALVGLAFDQFGPLCIDLGSSAAGWKLDLLGAPAAGPLADSLKPLSASSGPDLLARIEAGDTSQFMALGGRFPPSVYSGFGRLLEQARKDPSVAALVDEDLVRMFLDSEKAMDGRLAMRQGAEGNPFQQLGIFGVADLGAVDRVLLRFKDLVGKGGLADLMASSGLRMKWETGVRSSGAIKVDRLSYEAVPGAVPEAQARMMAGMMKPVEMAATKDAWVMGAPAAAVDRLLSGKPAAKPLALAAAGLPGSWDLRMDWDLPLQMKAQFAMMGAAAPGVPAMFQSVQGGEPLRIGVAFGPGRARALVMVPAGLVAQLAAGNASRAGGPGPGGR